MKPRKTAETGSPLDVKGINLSGNSSDIAAIIRENRDGAQRDRMTPEALNDFGKDLDALRDEVNRQKVRAAEW